MCNLIKAKLNEQSKLIYFEIVHRFTLLLVYVSCVPTSPAACSVCQLAGEANVFMVIACQHSFLLVSKNGLFIWGYA